MARDNMTPANHADTVELPAHQGNAQDSSFQMLATAVALLHKSIATIEAAVIDLGIQTEPSRRRATRGADHPDAAPLPGRDIPAVGRPLDDPHTHPKPPGTAPLTARQLEVLRLLTAGMSNRRIARKLGITEKTVKNHMQAIFARLAVSDRTQAALYAIRHRLSG